MNEKTKIVKIKKKRTKFKFEIGLFIFNIIFIINAFIFPSTIQDLKRVLLVIGIMNLLFIFTSWIFSDTETYWEEFEVKENG